MFKKTFGHATVFVLAVWRGKETWPRGFQNHVAFDLTRKHDVARCVSGVGPAEHSFENKCELTCLRLFVSAAGCFDDACFWVGKH